jgi:hypothetical protein
MAPSLRSRLVVLGLALICGTTVSLHFAFTVLHLLPLNPLRPVYADFVSEYMTPFFQQRWALFAPNPPLENKALALRCRLSTPEGDRQTPWVALDVMTINARRDQLFSPVERLGRVNRSVLSAALGTREETVALFRDKFKEKVTDAVSPGSAELTEEQRRYQTVAEKVDQRHQQQLEAMRPFVNRVASSYCEAFYGEGRVLATQFRIMLHTFPRYSERAQPDDFGKKQAIELPWSDFIPGIAHLQI